MTLECTYFKRGICSSCQWIEKDYPAQIQEKENRIREALSFSESFALEPSVLSPIAGFRNRAKMTVTGSLETPVIGLVGESELDQGREILSCPVHHPRINELISILPDWLTRMKVEPYRIRERTGELKGLICFHSPDAGSMYLRFIVRSRAALSRLKQGVPELQKSFPDLICISANLQPVPHAILEGPEEIFLTERKTMDHRLGQLVLTLSPQAFVQTNVAVAVQLYETASRWIDEIRPERLLELYCGQGAFSLTAAASAKRVLGVEINEDAVRTANDTAEKRGLSHVRFKCLDATKVAEELQDYRPDLILVNPPRRGLGNSVELILKSLPDHLIYSSCSIDTLATDLKVLSQSYTWRKVQLFDLFPHTHHFETLVWLVRRKM